MEKINFQNGRLISRGKVEVEGKVYDVEPPEYEGETPLSAQVLNLLQNNIEQAILEIEETIKGTILYENVDGTTGNITLNDSISNYNKIMIEFKTNNGYIGSELINNNKQSQIKAVLNGYNVDTNAHGWIKARGIKILETALTNEGYVEYVFHDGSISASNYIYITKITGYQY